MSKSSILESDIINYIFKYLLNRDLFKPKGLDLYHVDLFYGKALIKLHFS